MIAQSLRAAGKSCASLGALHAAAAGLGVAVQVRMLEAFGLGLLLGASSALHCVAMCGPLEAFVAVDPRSTTTEPSRVLRYQLGRVVGYGTLGALAGGLGATLAGLVPSWTEAILSFVLAAALAFAAVQLWPRTRARGLVAIGREPRGPTLRERASRASASLLGRVREHPLLLGVTSALLPCGVLLAGGLLAASSGSALAGAAAMAGLAIASGLAVGAAGLALGRVEIARSPVLARAMALTLALGALVLVVRPLIVAPDAPERCHGT